MTTVGYGAGLEERMFDELAESGILESSNSKDSQVLEAKGGAYCNNGCYSGPPCGRCGGGCRIELRPTLPKIAANTPSLLETYVSTLGIEKVKPEEISLLTKLEALDLDPIKVKLMDAEEGYGWTREQADSATTAYKQFLFINAKYEGSSIVPTKLVDKVWHQHILDTRKYAEDSQEIFGGFIHHFPYFGMRGEEDAANLESSFAETQNLFVDNFGTSQLASFDGKNTKASGCSSVCLNRCASSCLGKCSSICTNHIINDL